MDNFDVIDLNLVVDGLVDHWQDIVAPFYTNAPNSDVTYQSFGSGFTVLLGREIFLVTAHHVIEQGNERIERYGANGVFGNIGGVGFDMSGLKFSGIETEDVASAHLGRDWAETRNIKSVFPYNLNEDKSSLIRTGKFFVLGFPSSKNKLNERLNKKDRHIFAYSFENKKSKSNHTKIEDHEAFVLDINDMISTEGEKRRPPNFDGVSGSPVFEILCDLSDSNKIHFGVDLAGVFTEWRQKENEIVCSHIKNAVVCCLAHEIA